MARWMQVGTIAQACAGCLCRVVSVTTELKSDLRDEQVHEIAGAFDQRILTVSKRGRGFGQAERS
jgi:hypothetical protein